MPTNCCPKTCSQLSVAAILISIGITQLLAGIILLKPQDIHLLAGTDIVVALSNVLVGSLLGIAANVWEKKKKVVSLKSTARQNVLAGLYIAVMTMNATAAIIMILGDGSKLLTTKDTTLSGDLVFEILACAYVTSVCSPIVCLVIALVCLSGNRIRIYENMKKKDSITKKESYGWVFDNNRDNQSRNLKDSSTRNASVSDDNVFVEKKSIAEKFFKVKPSKKDKAKNSNSLSDFKSPMEIWAHKRNKIIEEITSPKPIFFADDYLQFPEHKYDSYIGTLIPRITQTSFIKTSSRDSAQTTQTADSENSERKIAKVDKTMSCKPSKPHLDELNLKLASRRMSYPDSVYLNGQMDEENLTILQTSDIESVDETDAQTLQSTHPTIYRTHAKSVGDIESQSEGDCFDFAVPHSFQSENQNGVDRSSSDWLQDPHSLNSLRRNSNDSGSSGLTAETISELKAKINKMNFDDDENVGQKTECFRSFKHHDLGVRKSHLSESDIEDKRSAFQKLHNQYGVFSQNSESDSKGELAGEIVPISIRTVTINRVSSIPLKTICSQAASRYSLNVKDKVSDQILDAKSETKHVLQNGESRLNQSNNSSDYKGRTISQADMETNKVSVKPLDRKCDFKHRMSVMGSIAESPTEEFLQIAHQNQKSLTSEASSSSPDENNERDSPKIRHSRDSRRVSLKAAPSLLNRLWSMKRSETKTDLTSLIMDSDSLVGLSDDDLMDRSRRLRQLRKSVELRSRAENQGNVV